ncbi:hypothetical protein HPB51_025726 [Rhipicephalus microplus]|uniref:Uncharacterized protein n=1 Tax=Rhipicephalus microplus TaxID=6941 RepID=A0A9J6DDT5_RHIMP|nr:hypothetical protein HPB51_025726 [Rhipicephalus microplus]
MTLGKPCDVGVSGTSWHYSFRRRNGGAAVATTVRCRCACRAEQGPAIRQWLVTARINVCTGLELFCGNNKTKARFARPCSEKPTGVAGFSLSLFDRRPSEARVPARYGRATSLVERGIGGGFGSRLPQSVGFSAAEDCAPRSAPRTVPRLIRSEELAAGSIPDTDCGTALPANVGTFYVFAESFIPATVEPELYRPSNESSPTKQGPGVVISKREADGRTGSAGPTLGGGSFFPVWHVRTLQFCIYSDILLRR